MKRMALINDLSGFGKCSLTAAIPVVSVMGIQACPLPTAILSAQTGFEHYFCDDYTEKMNRITDEWDKMEVSFDGILSGFLAGPDQIQRVEYFLGKFKSKDNLFFLDPVMGDDGRTYKTYSKELLNGMKRLALMADVMTPNLTELCLLADVDYEKLVAYQNEEDYIDRITGVCKELMNKATHAQSIVVTGIHCEKDKVSYMGNLVVSGNETAYIEKPYVGKSFSGTGDLFSSVVCGSVVKGTDLTASVKKAVDFLQTAIEDAADANEDSCHGVQFEKYLHLLWE